ncbi:hypothetical protein IGI04_010318 [Brassica rapa subsp. trilocularis]|uniref:MHD2 domain-containing protein n=1 Tax=Brassica rapa subsp. trilocularis TaxID=1813537 RepID=A0ABQ7MZT6_BRACM|nr:hypothetical protein IGI04_010318 [Brassica rapa subsp. trilocularis]
MNHHQRRESFSVTISNMGGGSTVVCPNTDLLWPFGKLSGLDGNDIRETAYEIFFTACRSSPGFGGKTALTFYSTHNNNDHHGEGGGAATSGGSPGVGSGSGFGFSGRKEVVTTPTSRVKRALGLKMLKRSPSRRMSTIGATGGAGTTSLSPGSGSGHVSPGAGFLTVQPSRPRRPLTSAEIMRQQMRVTEQSDSRLRKTLLRTLVGQTGRRAETIILPLELLRHLKTSEFGDANEYQVWQRRQLKVLEAGLLLHPSIPLDKTNNNAMRLREIVRQSENKTIDTSKTSDTMRTLCNVVVSLSWRSTNGNPSDVCHWADGYPLNIHLYVALLQSIFDVRDETLVLDEIDELLELMKKTWSTLGITRPVHNLCFTWVLFHQYVVTSQMEPDLLGASHAMLAEVANDAKKLDREALYVKLLTSTLASMQGWTEKRLLSYHDYFQRGNVGLIENLLPLALSSSRILGDDVTISQGKGDVKLIDYSGDRVDFYIRASIKTAFSKMVAEDTEECDDGGKGLVREMVPYEVDSIILRLIRQWIEEKLKGVQECLFRAKETEVSVRDFNVTFIHGTRRSRQSYIPTLPPLTRCNRDSRFLKLWKRATPCTASGKDFSHTAPPSDGHHPRPSTSRGTQRLYIRLNTLHFLSSHIHSLNKALSLNPKVLPATRKRYRHRNNNNSSYFDFTYAGIESACQHVSEVAAYRLIFLDSNSVFYESLYIGDVTNSRIRPALRVTKQNLTLMSAILADRAQALAMREVMKSSFEAFLMVLLAGGYSRVFYRSDHSLIEEDFENLKRVFCTCGEGLIPEEVVDRDAEIVEGVIQLMSQPTEQLMEDFSIVTCETSGMGMVGPGHKLPMPPTTGRWNRSDANTILRVLCHRNDRVANRFLKKSFQLPKRR